MNLRLTAQLTLIAPVKADSVGFSPYAEKAFSPPYDETFAFAGRLRWNGGFQYRYGVKVKPVDQPLVSRK